MSLTSFIFTHSWTKAELESILRPSSSDATGSIFRFASYLRGLAGKAFNPGIAATLQTGAVQATATLTVSSTGSVNDETCVIAGVTFTAKTSGATGNQFNISSTPATQAANMVTAFNASANLSGIVTASRVSGVVTLTAVKPGLIGNGLQISESLTNVALVAFAGGTDGSSYSLDVS